LLTKNRILFALPLTFPGPKNLGDRSFNDKKKYKVNEQNVNG